MYLIISLLKVLFHLIFGLLYKLLYICQMIYKNIQPMKIQHKILLLITLVASTLSAQASEKAFKNEMEKVLQGLEETKGKENWLQKATLFGNISDVHTGEWLPLYYQSYSYLQAGMLEQDLKKADPLYDIALRNIEKAESLEKSNSEILTLKSWILSMKLTVDPMNRGYEYGMKSNQLLGEAMDLDPDNPRPYFLKGISAFYTPEEFGGSKKAAKDLLNESIQKYHAFKPKSSIMPAWGLKEAKELLMEIEK